MSGGLGATYLLPDHPIETAEDFVAAGGGAGLEAARKLGPDGVVEELLASGLRGRGGAGFATGVKWRSVRTGGGGRRFAVANGAEGEPATFKDRMLMRRDPYRVIEGLAIAALAVGASEAFCATKRKYIAEVTALRRAALELSAIGLLGDLDVTIVEGPDEYLFGEEKALLEVIEGRDPLPTLLPPWQRGLFATVQLGWEADVAAGSAGQSNPTLVNNVETLASAAHILAKGATWFRSMGTAASPGTVIVTVVGDVMRSRVLEVELGTPLSAVLDACGGPRPGRHFVAAFSGVSNPVLPAAKLDVPLTYEDLEAAGSGLGAAGFVVYDDATDMASIAREFSRFLAVESCGQCPACKDGSMTITDRLLAIEEGAARDDDLAEIEARLRTVTDANRCYLGTEEQLVVSSILREFPEAFAARMEGTAGPLRAVLVPLIVDIADDGTVVYDERHARKQPDWTYR
ncbi:MAG TPA: NADH-ubiquinone oxidoreductase-F iron-sulfur binding region domain-containing protein [Acidimicrobiales bacterium]|nr:NADH-ubiquinone oxidoreductase-F iron-sulfur binding region domain-containing protein [Acidimicrobiales bacterium]